MRMVGNEKGVIAAHVLYGHTVTGVCGGVEGECKAGR